MEGSSYKVEAMKPVLLKALAVSLAGFVLARISTRKSSVPMASSQVQVTNVEEGDHYDIRTDQESFHSLGSECLPCDENDHAYADEILGLRRRLEDMLDDRELQPEKRFLYYQGLKDQEVALMDLHSKMTLEMNRVEFLESEVSLVQTENQRFENGAEEYLKLFKETDNGYGGTHEECGYDNEQNQRAVEQDDSYLGLTAREHAHARSKRRRLMAKFKRWVEGSHKTKASSLDEKEKHGNKCFPRHSVSDGAENAYILARKSCSSV